MLLREAQPEDIPVLYALWQEAFGDETETIDLYFDTCFCTENTLVAVCDDRVRAVIYLLPNALQNGEKTFPAAYIYAAATEKAYRGRGLMGALLDFAAKTAEKRGMDFLYLVPASKSLFPYYGARGFKTAFSKKIYTFSSAVLQSCCADRAELLSDYAETRFSVRERALQGVPHIIWQPQTLLFAKRLEEAFGVQSVYTENGFAVWETQGETADVLELCAVNDAMPQVLGALLKNCGASQLTLSVPPHLSFENAAYQTADTAMLMPLSESAKTASIQNAYIGITLG